MKSIWKWTLALTDAQAIYMPEGAEILSVQVQGDMPQVWALVDPEATLTSPRRIMIYGTGHTVGGDSKRYISTFQLQGGALVFHAFELL